MINELVPGSGTILNCSSGFAPGAVDVAALGAPGTDGKPGATPGAGAGVGAAGGP